MDSAELASCLRAWRDRLAPEDAGIAVNGTRRAPGLRREEVAQLAGLSLDYLARLEQGRASNPSPSVLAPLARVLQLSEAERAHLYRAAGHVAPDDGRMDRTLTAGVERLLTRLADSAAVTVLDAAWQVVTQNALAVALVGELGDADGLERNILWRHFAGMPTRFDRSEDYDGVEAFEREGVADLHHALGRYPADERLRELIEALHALSPRFSALWAERPVRPRTASHKAIVHPRFGRLEVDCDVLEVRGSGLRLVVYTAEPGSRRRGGTFPARE